MSENRSEKNNEEFRSVPHKKTQKNKPRLFLELEQTLSCSWAHLMQYLIVIAYFFLNYAETTSAVGHISAYFYI